MRSRETGYLLLTTDEFIRISGDLRNAKDIFLAQCEDALSTYQTEEETHPMIECMSILALTELPVETDDIECVVTTDTDDSEILLIVDYSISDSYLDKLHDNAYIEYAKNMVERYIKRYSVN